MSQASLSSSNAAGPKRSTARVAPQGGEKENRDPNDLNKHIKVDFQNVLAEPAGTHSFDCTWYFSETLYSCFLECCYKMATLFCGVCIAIYWAFQFAPLVFAHVWFLTPFYTLIRLVCGYWCKSMWYLCVRCCVSPVARSFAPLFRYCGNGLNERPESPSLFPKPRRRPKAEPVVAKPDTPPSPTGQWAAYDKGKIAKSVQRQLGLF